MTIAVIVLNWNGKQDTLECLSSLSAIRYPHWIPIVVDNGSTDDSVSAIASQFPDVTVLQSKENLGFAEGNNRGIRYALEQGAEAILLLNNDTIVDPEILHAFAAGGKRGDVLGAKLYSYREKNRLDHLGGKWDRNRAQFELIGKDLLDDGKSFEKMAPIDYVCGAALYAKKEVFDAIGLLEPAFFLYWEESDFCFRAKRAGFRVMTCPSAKVWHKGAASMTGAKPQTSYFFWRNRLLFIERNCSCKERLGLTLKILIPEICKLYRHHVIKSLQISFLHLFRPKVECAKKQHYLLRNRAAIRGVHDYLLRRFGNKRQT
jgi:hypothetical protein